MSTRAESIVEILQTAGGKLKANEIAKKLAKVEGVTSLLTSVVSATVATDNRSKRNQGESPKFRTYADGEDHGYVSLVAPKPLSADVESVLADYRSQIPSVIESANKKAREQLKESIAKLTWREFESNFLSRILEALGFTQVKITKATRDGGKDAFCSYRRGLVESEAIVSAKHWKEKDVGPDEVQRLRGIKGEADTGIIVTSASFSKQAEKEAAPSQNQRSIVLIDGDLIVDTCFANEIGVREVSVPRLFEVSDLKDDIVER